MVDLLAQRVDTLLVAAHSGSKVMPCMRVLLWIAVCPGAGAVELAKAWEKAPQCNYGLTVINLNDCIKGTVYSFTEEDRKDLEGLVRQGRARCRRRLPRGAEGKYQACCVQKGPASKPVWNSRASCLLRWVHNPAQVVITQM